MNDRVLRNVVVGLGAKADGFVREDHFVITVATEIMAILCLASDMDDLKERLGKIIVAYNYAGNDYDDYFAEAGRYLIEKGKGSVSILQRVYRIGFNRAARIMDQLEEAGVMGPEEGTKPRKVLMSMEEFEELLAKL